MTRIFQDDVDAIPRMTAKIAKQEAQRIQIKAREHKGWELSNLGASIRTNKKTLEKLISRQDKGVTLERKTTFPDGRKAFYYAEVQN